MIVERLIDIKIIDQSFWNSSIYITLMEKLFSLTLSVFPAGKKTRIDEKSIEQTTSLPCNKNLAIIKIDIILSIFRTKRIRLINEKSREVSRTRSS